VRRLGAVRAVRVETRAKLNLGLAIGPRRSDGDHEIATIFQSVTLADTLEIRRRPRGLRLRVTTENAACSGSPVRERVPLGANNLVMRAARLVRRRLGRPAGVSLHLVKRIPMGAGLGGGSADAAAAMVGLARLAGHRLTSGTKATLAAELGADVRFACLGGTALGLGRGERLRRLRLAAPFRAVIAMPRWRIATAAAYRAIDETKYGLTEWEAKLRFAQRLGPDEVTPSRCMRLGNSFEAVLGGRREEFASLVARLEAAGVRNPHLTGSGSAVFGMIESGRSVKSVIGRFDGAERLYAVGSARSSLRIRIAR
jgi:4-diphosphocytidyl-2-C-methyl-D-erythritol kinase